MFDTHMCQLMNRNQLLRTFGIRAVIAFVLWTIVFQLWIVPNGTLNNALTWSVVEGTSFGLKLTGHSIATAYQQDEQYDYKIAGVISIDDEPAVLVADACNGFELFALFAGFILCFPGRGKPKVVFIAIGIPFLFFLNIIREITLALNYHYFRVSFDFNHKYTYAIIVYLVVFLIWRYWLNRYSILADQQS